VDEGEDRTAREAAIALLKQGLTIDIIVRATGLSIETIQALQKEQGH
jgi:DNA-binding NarL/FixJ family response regulator